jgi:hypothetical protein
MNISTLMFQQGFFTETVDEVATYAKSGFQCNHAITVFRQTGTGARQGIFNEWEPFG